MTALRAALLLCLLIAACGGQPRVEPPTPAPTGDPAHSLVVPAGPVLYEPEQLIYPPEDFPFAADVARDAAIAVRAWERQFVPRSQVDFRWFVVRLYVLEPDVPSAKFVADNDCASITWDAEQPLIEKIAAPPPAEGARACVYRFGDGQRVLYYMTGFRNVGVVVGTQPSRAEVSDGLALEWAASVAKRQIAIIGGVLAKNGR